MITSDVVPLILAPVTAKIGSFDAEVLYAGAMPGGVAGIMQINVRLPAALSALGMEPVVTLTDQDSQAFKVHIR